RIPYLRWSMPQYSHTSHNSWNKAVARSTLGMRRSRRPKCRSTTKPTLFATSTPARSSRNATDERSENLARALVRRRLRSELDAGRKGARADPPISDTGRDGRARAHSPCARSGARGGRHVADRRAWTRQLGDGRLGGALR